MNLMFSSSFSEYSPVSGSNSSAAPAVQIATPFTIAGTMRPVYLNIFLTPPNHKADDEGLSGQSVKPWLKKKEAMDYIGGSASTLERWERAYPSIRRKVEGVGSILYSRSELDKVIDGVYTPL